MKNIIFLLISFLIISGCGEVHCPAFPSNFLGWFPLKTGTVLLYENDSDTSAFYILNNFVSTPSSFKKNCKCECLASSSYTSDISSHSGFNMEVNCTFNSESSIRFSIVYSNDTISDNFSFYFNKSQNTFENISFTTDYLTNSTTYSNVAVIENSTFSYFVKKIYFSTEKGIIAYVDKNNKEWKIADTK